MVRSMMKLGATVALAAAVVFFTAGPSHARGGGHGGFGGHGGGFAAHGGGFGRSAFHGGGYRYGGYRGGYYGGYHHYRGYPYWGYPYWGYGYYYPSLYGYYPYLDSSPYAGYSFGGYPQLYADSVTSFYPPSAVAEYDAAPAFPDDRAHVTVRVPANALVWVDGSPTTLTGTVREIQLGPLAPGSAYTYLIRATWENADLQHITQAQEVSVSPGAHLTVTFPVSSAAGR